MAPKKYNNSVPRFGTDQTAPHGLEVCQNSSNLVPTRSPFRVKQFSFLSRRLPTVGSFRNLERRKTLSLSKNEIQLPLQDSSPLPRFSPFFLYEEDNTIPLLFFSNLNNSKNDIYFILFPVLIFGSISTIHFYYFSTHTTYGT